MGRGLLTGMALATALLGVSAARAEAGGTITPLPDRLQPNLRHVAGPAFAGDAIAYAVPDARAGFDVKVRSPAGETTSQQVYTGGGGQIDTTQVELDALAASAGTVAFAETVSSCHDLSGCKYEQFDRIDTNVFAGPLGGTLEFRGCAGLWYPEGTPNVDVSGTVIAFMNSCAGGAEVRDTAGPARTPWRIFPSIGDVRIAGRYLAVDAGAADPTADAHTLTVYDWRTGDEVFSVVNASGPTAFDIQEDGTLAYVDAAKGEPAELAWASPQEPGKHVVAAWRENGALRVAAGKIAVRTLTAFHVFALDGTELATTPALDDSSASGFDFDGARATWVDQPCEVSALVTWDLDGVAPTLPAGACPAGAAAAPTGLVDLKRRRVELPLRCPRDPPLGCGGAWFARLNAKPGLDTQGRFAALRPGERRTVRFGISRWKTCKLARRHATRASVIADTFTYYVERGSVRTPARFKLRYAGRARSCR
jgi:hypothetical protein